MRVVTAHELGHIAHHHILKRVGWLMLFLLPAAALVALFTKPRGGLARPEAVPVALFVFVLLQLLTTPLMNIVSRREEAEADWSALKATRDPTAARSLFRELAKTSLANPDPPTWSYVLFADHPTIVQRIAMVDAWQSARTRRCPRAERRRGVAGGSRRLPARVEVRAFAHVPPRAAQIPALVRRFNQSERDVLAIAVPWVKEEWFDEGDRRWNSNEATLTILEGPKLSMPDLAMGSGWRNAQRRSEDVTERVLAASLRPTLRRGPARSPAPRRRTRVRLPPRTRASRPKPPALPRARHQPTRNCSPTRSACSCSACSMHSRSRCRSAWRLAAERLGDASAAESLALAELAVRSLPRAGSSCWRRPAMRGRMSSRPADPPTPLRRSPTIASTPLCAPSTAGPAASSGIAANRPQILSARR